VIGGGGSLPGRVKHKSICLPLNRESKEQATTPQLRASQTPATFVLGISACIARYLHFICHTPWAKEKRRGDGEEV
jgi:hypothetical protein